MTRTRFLLLCLCLPGKRLEQRRITEDLADELLGPGLSVHVGKQVCKLLPGLKELLHAVNLLGDPVRGEVLHALEGHVYGVQYGTRFLVEAAAEANCDIAVYGHTHVAEYTPGTPITVLNPGSAARPRDAARGSFMTVDLAPGKAPEVRLHRLGQK